MNIAVCDDEKEVREQIKGLLRRQNQTAILYASGEELLAAKEQYDIVFLDIQLDGKNGIENSQSFTTAGQIGNFDLCHRIEGVCVRCV